MIAPLTNAAALPENLQVFEAIQQKFGMVPNIFRVMGHQPAVLAGFAQLYEALQGDLPGRLREIAYLRSSAINHCSYCSHYHRMAAAGAGLTTEQVEAVVSGNEAPFDECERLVLRFADQLTRTAEVDSATVSGLREFLSEAQYVTLAVTVGVAGVTNRFNHACRVELP